MFVVAVLLEYRPSLLMERGSAVHLASFESTKNIRGCDWVKVEHGKTTLWRGGIISPSNLFYFPSIFNFQL
jgi:hypothetical protein